MDLETEEISKMVVEGAGGGSHHNENKQQTRESSISAEETLFDITDDRVIDASNCMVNKVSNDELKNGVFAGNNTNVDSRENVGEVGNQEKETLDGEHDKEEQITVCVDMQNNGAGLAGEEGANEMFTVSEDNVREETVMGNLSNQDTGEEKDLQSLTETVALDEKEEIIDDDTNTTKEVLLVPKKKVIKPKKVVKKVIKKRKLVKGKVLAKNEEEPQSSEMPESVEVPTNQNMKNEENPDAKPMDNVSSSLTDAVTLNEKEETGNDDTNTTKEVPLVPNKKVLKLKKVVKKIVKKRKLVKGKVVAKDEEEPQSSEMPEPSAEVQTSQNVENEENPDAKPMDEVKRSVTDAVTLNEKEEIINDDTNTTNEVLLVSNNKLLKPKRVVKKVIKKVVKRRKLVKGKVVTKDDGEPQSSEMPEPSVDVQTNQNVKNEENPDAKPMDNVSSSSTVRTKKKNVCQITDGVAVKSKQSEKNDQVGKGKAALESENMDNMEEAKSKLSKTSSRKAEKSGLGEVPAEHNDEAEPSEKHKSSSEVETVGMIFMCSSKTKEDCYRYKIFGLPASKKDVVLKVYKGMKLFLFDCQLKVLYGIYKAAGPGGYNIEPNAFHSNFPSQVRFTIVHDYNPLPEVKFKKVIKDNYYTKNKFSCELNSKQVTSLCELFRVDKKGTLSKAKAVTDRPNVGIRPIVEREKRKARAENDVNQGREKRRAVVDSERDIKRRRVVDDVKRSKAKGDVDHPRVNGDVRPSRVNGDVRRPRARGDMRRPRAEGDTRRLRLEDDARRSRAKDDTRRARAKDDARRSRLVDDARRSRLEDDARRSRLEDDARRSRLEDDARRLRLEDDARRLRAEDDARRLLDEGRRHSPHILNNRYPRLADVYEREAYLPSAFPAPLHLDALPPPAVPTYTSSYAYGSTSVLDDYRPDVTIKHENRGLSDSGSRLLYEYQSRDRYLPYREPIEYRDPEYALGTRRFYSPIASRDEYLPSTSRISGYRVSPYRRY